MLTFEDCSNSDEEVYWLKVTTTTINSPGGPIPAFLFEDSTGRKSTCGRGTLQDFKLMRATALTFVSKSIPIPQVAPVEVKPNLGDILEEIEI